MLDNSCGVRCGIHVVAPDDTVVNVQDAFNPLSSPFLNQRPQSFGENVTRDIEPEREHKKLVISSLPGQKRPPKPKVFPTTRVDLHVMITRFEVKCAEIVVFVKQLHKVVQIFVFKRFHICVLVDMT